MSADSLLDFFKEEEPKIIYAEQPDMTELEMSLWNEYGKAWSNRRLSDAEYPHEDICAVCTGCGTFKKEDGEDGECVQDKIEGECYYRYFDAEEFGQGVADLLTNKK